MTENRMNAVSQNGSETDNEASVTGARESVTGARAYSAVFFDLDGTLLSLDTKEFMKAYMASIGRFMAERGIDPEAGGKAIFAGVMAMGQNVGGTPNKEAFWKVFCGQMGKTPAEWEPMFMEYYTTRFDGIAEAISVEANPDSADAVRVLRQKGYRLAVTTMPMFPQVAVEARLRWAGLDPRDFEFLTTYENSSSVKPYEAYYAEALDRIGLAGSDVLMVGNHNREDGGATKLGCDIYFVTDHLIEVEDGVDVASHKHGTMEEFRRFCESLPPAASQIA